VPFLMAPGSPLRPTIPSWPPQPAATCPGSASTCTVKHVSECVWLLAGLKSQPLNDGSNIANVADPKASNGLPTQRRVTSHGRRP
jgi:hypothetical protein